GDDLAGIEVLFGQLAREAAVSIVIAGDRLQEARCIGQIPEAEQSGGIGQEAARAGVLDHGRLAAGQVAERTVADPGGLEAYVVGLGAAEFTPRVLDVALVVPG